MTRAGCYTLDSAHLMVHFVRKARATKKASQRDVGALADQLSRAETDERKELARLEDAQ